MVLGQRLPLPSGSYPVKFLQVRSLLVDIRQQVLYLAGDLDIAEGITFRGRRQVGIPGGAEHGPSRGRFCLGHSRITVLSSPSVHSLDSVLSIVAVHSPLPVFSRRAVHSLTSVLSRCTGHSRYAVFSAGAVHS